MIYMVVNFSDLNIGVKFPEIFRNLLLRDAMHPRYQP